MVREVLDDPGVIMYRNFRQSGTEFEGRRKGVFSVERSSVVLDPMLKAALLPVTLEPTNCVSQLALAQPQFWSAVSNEHSGNSHCPQVCVISWRDRSLRSPSPENPPPPYSRNISFPMPFSNVNACLYVASTLLAMLLFSKVDTLPSSATQKTSRPYGNRRVKLKRRQLEFAVVVDVVAVGDGCVVMLTQGDSSMVNDRAPQPPPGWSAVADPFETFHSVMFVLIHP